MMRHKKNRFWTFLFSLFPGAGEMYMGFMKQGVSLMTLFLGSCVFCAFFQFDAGLFILPIIWFYSFFHVHNLKALSDEEFSQVEDDYLFHMPDQMDLWRTRKKQIFLAWSCIIIGSYALWRVILDMLQELLPWEVLSHIYSFSYLMPQIILSILLIGLGIHLIKGKKEQLDSEKSEEERFARDAFGEDAFGKDHLEDFFPDKDSTGQKNNNENPCDHYENY